MYDRRNPQSGPGYMTGDASRPAHALPLAAPRPGYPAPIANLNISSLSPTASPFGQSPKPQQMGQVPQALHVIHSQADIGAPRMPPPIYQTAVHRPSVPSTPHPLQPPMTPITPVFVRPSRSPAPSDIKFNESIMRGNSEDNLLPKRGQRGDDFWRRFSMVAKEEKKPSSWLAKTQSGTSRLSRWVWMIGVGLLIGVGFGIGLWYYISHTTPSNQLPTAVGGSANETDGASSPTAGGDASSSHYVTPTFTLGHRGVEPTPLTFIPAPPKDIALAGVSKHKKKHQLRDF